MVYSKKMLRALEKVVWAYEQAILDLEENGVDVDKVAKRWKGYGTVETCRLCAVTGIQSVGDERCKDCVLCYKGVPCNRNVITSANADDIYWDVSVDNLYCALFYTGGKANTLAKAFRARLSFILKRAEKNGIVLE